MPKRNRQTLKESFRQGKKPTELDFENLIDSTINILDDGFSKTPDEGVTLAPIQGRSTLVSISRGTSGEQTDWEISLDPDTGRLSLGSTAPEERRTRLCMDQSGGVEMYAGSGTISVKGEAAMEGRRGLFAEGAVAADGKWYYITESLEGCWALEVVAGCGKRGSGRHTLIVATAVHCFGNRPSINRTESWYGSRGNKIRLRWVRDGGSGRLQASTKFSYGPGITIKYHITRLWYEPFNQVEQ